MTLTALSILFIASPISSESSLSQVHRRSIPVPPLVLRQEDPPVSTPTTSTEDGDTTNTSSSTSTTSVTSTDSTTSTTTSTTRSDTSTTSASTRTVTSTRPTSTGTTTQTITSTTSASSTGTTTSPSGTTSSAPSTTLSDATQRTPSTDPTSGTTLSVPADFAPVAGNRGTTTVGTARTTSGNSGSTSTSVAGSTGAAKKSFWDNKGAVAGVFVVIAIVALGLLGLLWRALAKRRASARQRRLTAMFGSRYTECGGSGDTGHPNDRTSAYGDVESGYPHDNSRFQGAPVTVGELVAENPFEPTGHHGAAASNPWSPPPVASTPVTSAQAVATGYQPPHSAASYESAQSHYYTPPGSEQSHVHYAPASHGPAVNGQYMPPSQALASASSLSAYSGDPSVSAHPPTGLSGARWSRG
ncbi:hypothetical protein NMY22_g2426 [Coprinellus aureogranulatus]|nr:hypothetical protein NMY22_g2426 [Coprinellus aureogranulatus]